MSQSNPYTTTCACRPCCPPPCPPPCPPRPDPTCIRQVQEADISCGCDCAAGLVAALQLLCDSRFASLTDYNQFAFVTANYIIGSSLSCPETSPASYDNLTGPLAASFVGITPNSCDRLRVSGQIYYAQPAGCDGTPACCAAGPAFPASEISVCSITAVSFGVASDLAPITEQDAYEQMKLQLWQATHKGCTPPSIPPSKPTPCDTGSSQLSGRRTLSLTAGPLLLGNAAVLGSIGDVLILANDTDRRFYYVCQNAIGFTD